MTNSTNVTTVINQPAKNLISLIQRFKPTAQYTSRLRRGLTCSIASACLLAGSFPMVSHAEDQVDTLKIAVLKFGTVNWELDTIKHYELDKKHSFNLDVLGLANGDATSIAFQSGEVDMITDDFLWVNRERQAGKDFTITPYSFSVGALMTNKDITSAEDLVGKKIGIAGGPLDKSWLILQAYAKKNHNIDLAKEATIEFSAPPLLNKLIQEGKLDAVLNYWHYTAALDAAGFNRLIDMPDAAKSLGLPNNVPLLGYVFREELLAKKPDLIPNFVAASQEAKQLLKTDPEAFDRLRKRMKAVDDDTKFEKLKTAFIAGIPTPYTHESVEASEAFYKTIVELGGDKLTGDSAELVDGTFYILPSDKK